MGPLTENSISALTLVIDSCMSRDVFDRRNGSLGSAHLPPKYHSKK